MGKKLVEKKKKKKGRPSLLDLQKRSLRLQQQEQPQQDPQKPQKPNPNSNPNPYLRFPNPNPSRRSTRRNPSGLDGEEDDEEDEDEDDDSNGKKRREKKLKLVLRLPPSRPSPSLNSRGGGGSDDGSDSDGDTPLKKRKIDDVAGSEPEDRDLNDGSAWEKAERHNSGPKAMDQSPGMPLDSGATLPLPDKKLLVFILDRLQKKDTYGVFSDPVDPNELPDYHEVIEHPMDFSTVRKKLASGAYAHLEQFEKDVLLICSNAMRYNAPDTIYFRQARSMQELAKRDFENLRQESDGNEPEIKSVRRGRPPGKNSIKRMMGRLPIDRAGSDFSSDATLATAGDNAVWSNSATRKTTLSDKLGIAEVSARTSYGSRNGDTYGWLADHKSERNDDFPGSVLKGMSKFAKNKLVFDEDRRNTYKQFHQSVSRRESSVLTTFDGEKKQLMAIGVHMEHAYARSLARFAANLGPVAWKVVSRKIEKVLPAGVKFGPGWVGENDVPQPREPLISACPPRLPLPPAPPPPPPFQPPSQLRTATGSILPRTLESRGDKSSEKQEPLNNSALEGHLNRTIPPSTAATPALPNRSSRSSGPTENSQTIRGMNFEGGFGLLSSSGMIRPNPPFQIHQNPAIQSTINGFNGGFGFNMQNQVGKMVRPARPAGNFGPEVRVPSRMIDTVSRTNSSYNHQMPMMPSPLNVKSLQSTLPPTTSIRFASLPFNGPDHGLPPNSESTDTLPYHLSLRFLQAFETLKPSFENLITELSREDGRPPLCIITDMFLGWTVDIANQLGIFHTVFIVSGAYGTAVYFSLWLNLPHSKTDSDEFPLPDFPESASIHRTQLTNHLKLAKGSDAMSQLHHRLLPLCFRSDGLLFNTVEDLEKIGLEYFRRKMNRPVWAIGPVKSVEFARKEPGISVDRCLSWLNLHRPNSVLFISFGSQNTISASQVMELAMGLEASGSPFIWVIRPPVGFDINGEFRAEWLPEGFEERMTERKQGMLVRKWGPQLEILSHGSTGAFLSHCGWNSTMESLSRGVPLIGWPLSAEQFYNVKMMEEKLGVCVEIARGHGAEIERSEVERVIKEVMGGNEKGEEMRRKALGVKEMMKDALREDERFVGSSLKALDEFLTTALCKDGKRNDEC